MLKRTVIGATVLAVLVGAWWFDGRDPGRPAWALAALGLVVSLGALVEVLAMGRATRRRRNVGLLAGGAWVGLMIWAGLDAAGDGAVVGDVLAAGSLVACLTLVLQIPGGARSGRVARCAESLWFAVPYAGGLAGLVTLLLAGRVDLAVTLVLVAKSSDIGAYFAGKAFGRRPLAPAVSPKKTWEGVWGGVALSTAVAIWLLPGAFPAGEAPGPAAAAVMGVVLAAVAIVSDLAESLLKRACGVKDSGTWLGEAGGFLDLADSLLMVAPLALAYTAFLQVTPGS